MVIAVTGGHGFLGSAITAHASQEGHDVVKFGRPAEVVPSEAFSAKLGRLAPDAIVHAAGPASVAKSFEDPDGDRAGSVSVFDAVLRQAAALPRLPQVALISSAAVYGQPESLPVAEDAPRNPVSPYGHHRTECEDLLSEYRRQHGPAVVALRVFSAYGEGLRRQLLWDIASRASTERQLVLGGTGDETRDFIHVTDIARAVLLALTNRALDDDRLNVASGDDTTIREVAQGLLEARGLPDLPLEFSGKGRLGDPQRWRADIHRLTELGFTARVPLATGLRRYADWFSNGST